MLLASVASFVLVTVVATVSARLSMRLWRGVPELGIAFGIIGVALTCWLQFLASWASPLAGAIFAITFGASFLIAFGVFRLWRWLHAELGVVVLALGLLFAYLGLTYLWATGSLDGFSLAALRFSFHDQPYPIDNVLPTLMANRIHEGGSTHGLVLSWNGSDRPPLQSGGILLVNELFGGLQLQWWDLPMAIGVVLQLLWVPAIWALLRFVGVDRLTSALSVVFAGSTATMLLNTTYTWPKLLSAALVIVSLMLLLAVMKGSIGVVGGRSRRGARSHARNPLARRRVVLAAGRRGARSARIPAQRPAVDPRGARVGRGRRRRLSALAVLSAFRRPAGRPAAEVSPRGRGRNHRPFGRRGDPARLRFDLVRRLGRMRGSSTSAAILSPSIFTGFAGVGDAAIGERRFHEYYETSAALGLAALLIVGIAVACIVTLLRRRPLRDRILLGLMALMLPCIAFWWLVMFQSGETVVGSHGGTVVHQGSHVWLLLLIALSFAWVVKRHAWAGLPLVVVQAGLTAWFYIPFFGHSELRPAAAVVSLAGCAIVALGVLLSVRRQQASIGGGDGAGREGRRTSPPAAQAQYGSRARQ